MLQNNFIVSNNNEVNVIEEVQESMDNINESSKFNHKIRNGDFLFT